MIDQQFINDLNQKISAAIPDDVKTLCRDLDQNLKSVVQGVLAKVDMVPREEFDAQCQVLARTRTKLEALERTLSKLEQNVEIK